MKHSVFAAMMACAVFWAPVREAHAQTTNSPVGIWETTWLGSDRGLSYLTFSNDFTVAGYGISLKSFGTFTVAGTWAYDSRARVVAGYTQLIDGDNAAGSLIATVPAGKKIRARAIASNGKFKLKGEMPVDYPDVTGAWVAEITQGGNHSFQTYTIAPSPGMPAMFDITGEGIGNGGTFTVTGAIIVSKRNRANAFLVSDFGTLGTSAASVTGKVFDKSGRMVLVGRDDSRKKILIRAEQQQAPR